MKKTEKNKYLPYGRQHIDANDIQEVVSVLESDYLTTGKKTIDFEIEFSKKVNVKYAVSCSSGTAISCISSSDITGACHVEGNGSVLWASLLAIPGNKRLRLEQY